MIGLFNRRKKRNLNALERRKKIRRNYLIFFLVFAILLSLLASYVAIYRNSVDEINIITGTVNGIKHFKEYYREINNFSGKYTGKTFLGYGVIWFFICALLWLNEERHYHDMPDIESGSARWNADGKKFDAEFGDPDPYNTTLLAKGISLSLDDRKTARNSNILTVGGAGTGKSRYHIKPNLLQANANYIVNDPSGELIASTAHCLIKQNYEIKVLNLIEVKKSSHYNPFHYLRDELSIMSMINCLIENTTPPNEHGGDPFWVKAETNILMAVCFYLWQHRPVEDQNFATVMKLLRMAEVQETNENHMSDLDRIFLAPRQAPKKSALDRANDPDDSPSPSFLEWQKKTLFWRDGRIVRNSRMLSLEEMDPEGKDIAVNLYKTFRVSAGRTAKGILTSVMSRLQAFNIDAVCELTSIDNMHLEELSGLVQGHEKQALFLVLPQADDTFAFLVSMLYTQLFETLEYLGATRCNDSRLPRNVKCLMDEFSNCCRVPQFQKHIATIRKYGISCDVVLQSLSQIQAQYDKDWETIVGNCDTKLFLGSTENTTTKYISELLGNQTITTRDRSASDGKTGHASQSYKNSQRPLMYPDEIANMPNSDCLVVIRGVDPFYVKKYDYKAHPRYRETGDANPDFKYEMPVTSTQSHEETREVIAQRIRAMSRNSISPVEDPSKYAEGDWAEIEEFSDRFRVLYSPDAEFDTPEQPDSGETARTDKQPEDVAVKISDGKGGKQVVRPLVESKAPPAPYDPSEASPFETSVAEAQRDGEWASNPPSRPAKKGQKLVVVAKRAYFDDEG